MRSLTQRLCALPSTLLRARDRMVTFYDFPREHWEHLRTNAGKRYNEVLNATSLIWKLSMVAERTFRRLDHPQLLPEAALGAQFNDGIRIVEHHTANHDKEHAARGRLHTS